MRLAVTNLGDSKVIEAELTGKFRLSMAREQRLAAGDDGPLGEPFAVPSVVLGHLMKLRQVKGEHFGVAIAEDLALPLPF